MPGDVFQIKYFKANRFNIDEVRRELLNELRRQGRLTEKALEKTTNTWTGAKPRFESIISLTRPPGQGSVFTGPTGDADAVEKWVRLDRGTRQNHPSGYDIVPHGDYPLHFIWDGPGSYEAKTTPEVLDSWAGGPRGRDVYFWRVHHPGFVARNWTGTYIRQNRRKYTKGLIDAARRGMEKARANSML